MIARALWIGCVMAAVLSIAAAQTSGPRVELSLIVTDKDEKPITVRKEELHVFEGKAEQTILSVEPDTRPIDLVLAVDTSGSLRTLFVPALNAAGMIVRNVRPEDEIFIERFISSDKIEKVHDFSSDTKSLLKAVKELYLEGGQSAVVDGLYVAVQAVAEHNQSRPGRRRVIVVITDGEDRSSYYSSEKLIDLIRAQGVQVFALGLTAELKNDVPSNMRPSPRARAEMLLKNITQEGGGRTFFARNAEEVIQTAVPQLLAYLRAQFVITYQSLDDSGKKGFRKVELKLDSPNDEKRSAISPRGYFYPSLNSPQLTKEKKSP